MRRNNCCFPLFLLLALALSCLPGRLAASSNQKGYRIAVRIDHCSDSLILLSHYWGNKAEMDDTARRNQSGWFVFEGSDPQDEGLYFISGQQGLHYIDFFITSNQHFELGFDSGDPYGTANGTASVENADFFRVLSALNSRSVREKQPDADSAGYILGQADVSKAEIRSILAVKAGDSSLAYKFITASIEPGKFQQYFGPVKKGTGESTAHFFVDHYFDNIDFTDNRLIYTPVLSKRIDQFLDTIGKVPGVTVQSEIDRLLELSARNSRTAQFVAWYLMTRFETYYFIEGNDALFVHLVNDYLLKGKTGWYFPELKDRELKQLQTFEPLLNGKPAPDLEMPDSSNHYHDLYDVKSKYTLLLFWASSCSHCRDEMPSIVSFYKEFHSKYNLEIFGVSTDTSVSRWKSYIRRHNLSWVNVFGRKSIKGSYHLLYDIRSTPVLYLLDDKKIILSKYLNPEKAAAIIRQREDKLRP